MPDGTQGLVIADDDVGVQQGVLVQDEADLQAAADSAPLNMELWQQAQKWLEQQRGYMAEIAHRGSRERRRRPSAAGSPPPRASGRDGPPARPCA